MVSLSKSIVLIMAVENIATAVNASIEQVQSWINARDNASAI